MATAYLTLLLIIAHYVLDCFPLSHLNTIDRGFLRFVRRKLKIRGTYTWAPTIHKSIMMLSDQQLVTGIAILAGGYSQLPCGRISLYHWQLVVYLAWFSSLTHLTTLTVLRQYFREHPTIRIWRVSLMLCVLLPLSVALLPTGAEYWSDSYYSSDPGPGVPALCAFRELAPSKYAAGDLATPTMAVSLSILFTSYTSRVAKLFPETDAFAQRWLRTKPGDVLKGLLSRLHSRTNSEGVTKLWSLAHLMLLSLFLIFRAMFDLFGSMLWEVRHIQCIFSNIPSSWYSDSLALFRFGLGYQSLTPRPCSRKPAEKRLGFWAVDASFDASIAAVKSQSAMVR